MMRATLTAISAISLGVGPASLAACALDFGQFTVSRDAGPVAIDAGALDSALDSALDAPVDVTIPPDAIDTGTRDAGPVEDADAGSEADSGILDGGPTLDGCVGLDECLVDAGSCGSACGATSQQCQQGCSNNGCRVQCMHAESTCRASCASSCVACTTAAGCPDNPGCADAAAMP
jgi:hypothetical protein